MDCWSWQQAGEGHDAKGSSLPFKGELRRHPWQGQGEALRRSLIVHALVLSLLPPLGCTLVDDPQGLFKKHREEELEERRKLYKLA